MMYAILVIPGDVANHTFNNCTNVIKFGVQKKKRKKYTMKVDNIYVCLTFKVVEVYSY